MTKEQGRKTTQPSYLFPKKQFLYNISSSIGCLLHLRFLGENVSSSLSLLAPLTADSPFLIPLAPGSGPPSTPPKPTPETEASAPRNFVAIGLPRPPRTPFEYACAAAARGEVRPGAEVEAPLRRYAFVGDVYLFVPAKGAKGFDEELDPLLDLGVAGVGAIVFRISSGSSANVLLSYKANMLEQTIIRRRDTVDS